jgi:hypothetical protein
MRSVSVGHLVLDDEQVAQPQWEFALNGQATAVTDGALTDWNYFTDISVGCTVSADLKEVRETLSTGDDTGFAWVLIARSTGSPVITASRPVEVKGVPQEIRMELPAASLGGSLTVELQMAVCRAPAVTSHSFSPSKVGHTVYSAETRVALEGDGGQLPLLPVSFKSQGIKNASTALWWLKVMSHDLYAPANAALWLWLNTDNEVLRPLLESAGSEGGATWLQFLKIDFTRQLLREALTNKDLDTSLSYPEGSFGEVLTSVVHLVGSSLENVRSKYEEDPGQVEAELQAIVMKAQN